MKKLILLISMLLCVSCTSKTEFGPCVGAFDQQDPTKIYKLNGINLAIGIIFFELIAPPIIVLVDETFCPIGLKEIK